ncbi:hypothetical protein SY88_04740 [Clostridiales bacterium PH28_bin88]|nr:hypothetical protein SY88_04740 [Clostridiales bacterium PH28_bin88]
MVEENRELRGNYRLMVVKSPEVAGAARPGQFVHVRCGSGTVPLLRRPISIHRVWPGEGRVGLLYEVKGRGTAWMAGRKPGETLDILGPLGNGFRLAAGERRLVLVAGGVGIAPLFFLAEAARRGGRQVRVLLGGRNREMILAEDDLRQMGIPVEVTTDDGSYGHHGLVTGLLAEVLEREEVDRVCACGPQPMLVAVTRLSVLHEVPCYVSLEEHMACGVGACRGCVVGIRDAFGNISYRNVCTHGPVFEAREVVFDGA